MTDIEDARDDLLSGLTVPRPPCLGLVSAVVAEGKVSFRAYGESGDPEKALNEDALFDVGSIAKVFTGVLFAEMTERGVIRPEDPLALHLPEGVEVPSQDGRQITLIDLATHASGLPRLPPNFATHERFDSKNPYAHYGQTELLEGLAQSHLEGRIGETVSYSNFGFELLGLALARAGESSYSELIKARVCEPLGLKDTEVWEEERQDARLVPGHDDVAEKTPFWSSPMPGDGGIVTNARDLASFVEANINGEAGSIGKALKDARQPRVLESTGHSVGLGWIVAPEKQGVRYHWHNGGVGGYGSFMAVEVDKQTGVVLLANSRHSDALDAAGVRLLDRLCGVG